MAWVITRMCRDCVDMACVEVCPVDCIVQHKDKKAAAGYENQLYIDPEECINCGVCEPECPWEAIFEDEQVPTVFEADVAVMGAPFDFGCQWRSGARMGPRAIREASTLQAPDAPYGWPFDVLSECAIVDYGDLAFDYANVAAFPGALPRR